MAKEEKKNENEMEYRLLGGTGLKVSCLGFGFMTPDSVEQTKELMKASRPNATDGVNFFDHSEYYGDPVGSAETYFGKALKELQKEDPNLWRRSDLVITTKLFWGTGNGKVPNGFANLNQIGINEMGLSRKHLIEGINGSLKRLQLDYVDVVFAHSMCLYTPMIEIVEGFNQIIKDGKAFYWGTSCWPPVKIVEAYWVAKMNGLIPPCVEQPQYSMTKRDSLEKDYVDVFKEPYNIGTTIWSPLDGGLLTGKYCDKEKIPKGSRIGGKDNRLSSFWAKVNEEDLERVRKLLPVAKELNITMVALALGWTLKNKNTSVCLLGARKASQVEQNLKAVNAATKLTKDVMDKIEKILDNKPKYTFRVMGSAKVKRIIDSQ